MKIIAYLKTNCPWCIELKEFFIENNIAFQEKDVSKNPEFFEEMKNISEQTKAPTVIIDDIVHADVGVDEIRGILKL